VPPDDQKAMTPSVTQATISAPDRTPDRTPFRTALGVLATFLGSVLLFSLEPYVGKLLLPAFGGTPLLWNSCMVFFQVALLLGYGLALVMVTRLSEGRQTVVQLILLASLFFAYPRAGHIIELPGAPPALSLVASLTQHILLTFVALAALTTLVQSWLTESATQRGSNPYRLYAASNAGSMFGLFAYPLVFEPWLSLEGQRLVFLVLLALVIACVAAIGLTRAAPLQAGSTHTPRMDAQPRIDASPRMDAQPPMDAAEPFTRTGWFRVIALTAIPSSLLLSVTNYILTDIASLPLFWIVPLALYLITFIIAFGGRFVGHYRWLERGWTLLVLFVVVALAAEANSPASILIPVHLLTFFIACLLCHFRVVTLAPHPRYLPQFYLAVSVGGAVGGMLTLLIPPLVTDRMSEYPLALVLAATVLRATDPRTSNGLQRAFDLALPAVLVAASAFAFYRFASLDTLRWSPLIMAPAALFVLQANERGPAFVRRLGGLAAASLLLPSLFGTTKFAERSFFGRVRVTYASDRDANLLVHGSTVHGMQRVSQLGGCIPGTYYHRTGPIGRLLTALPPAELPRRIALVGLGSGALACYARAGERWDLFELDPVVARVASDTAFFTFLAHSKASQQTMTLGDARLALERDTVSRYDVMIVDAFSSDAIPIHLLTRQAVQGYVRHLAPKGVLVFHVSNRFFALQPVLQAVAVELRLTARAASDFTASAQEIVELKYPSQWVVLATAQSMPVLDAQWTPIAQVVPRVWTDEYSNPLGSMALPFGLRTVFGGPR
jgi:spermidine synthase